MPLPKLANRQESKRDKTMAAIATLTEVKNAIRIDDNAEDALLGQYISGAEGTIRGWLGDSFVEAILTKAAMSPPDAQAVRDKSILFSALCFFARELYEQNPHEFVRNPTPHAFYVLLKPLYIRAKGLTGV